MGYRPHWSLKILMSVSFILLLTIFYHEVLWSMVAALDGVGTYEYRQNIMIISMLITTLVVLACALAISYYFEMYVTSIIIAALVIVIATPVISDFHTNTSPLS